MVQVVFQFDEVGAFQGNVNHAALGASVEPLSEEQGAAALEVIEDVPAHGLHIVGHNIDGLVGLHALHDEVDDLTFDVNHNDGIDGQTNLLEGNQSGEGDDGIDDHHQSAEGDFRVFVDDHGDDVATAGSGS